MAQGTRIRRLIVLLCMLAALSVTVAGCGSSSSSSSGTASASTSATTSGGSDVALAKTKFVLHAGLAFGAFHRWIYKPLKVGTLGHPLLHKATAIKAALAAGFVVHELKLALHDAQASPTLSKFVSPITALQNRLGGTAAALKSGTVDSGQLNQAAGAISSIQSQAAAGGQPITEQTPALP